MDRTRTSELLACVDVDYRDAFAVAACLLFSQWEDAAPREELVTRIAEVEPYRPGEFYRRELPCLLAVLAGASPRCVIIDGYVWLGEGKPGLGARLHEALGRGPAVVGVAKTSFHGAGDAIEVMRGSSKNPLYVTAVGIDPAVAAEHVRAMHGPHRLPTLLKRVDRLCRDR